MLPTGRFIFIFLLAIFCCGQAHGQDTLRYLNFGAGWNYRKMLDKRASPLIYKGNEIIMASGIEKHKINRISRLEIFFRYGRIRPEINTNSALDIRADINGTWLWRVKEFINEDYRWYAGGGFHSFGSYRNIENFLNNNHNFNYTSSLTLENYLERSFDFGEKSLDAGVNLSLPVLNWIIRPAYAFPVPDGYFEHWENDFKAILSSGRFHLLGKLFRVHSQVYLTYNLKNNNAVRLVYDWDFYRYNIPNELAAANQGIYIITMFNF